MKAVERENAQTLKIDHMNQDEDLYCLVTVVFVIFIIAMHVVKMLISIDFMFIMTNHYSKSRNFLDAIQM